MVEYLATVNTPGCMPHGDEFAVFDTAQEAWQYLAAEREHVEDYTDSDTYTRAVADLKAMTEPGTVNTDNPDNDPEHDLGLAYSVCEVGHDVTGEIDGHITHASAKGIANAWVWPDGGPVEAFVFTGKIPYGDIGELWSALVTSAQYADVERGERRLLDLLRNYITHRAENNLTGPVAGWPGMDVRRKYAPWDINPDECLTCGGESGLCSCLPDEW